MSVGSFEEPPGIPKRITTALINRGYQKGSGTLRPGQRFALATSTTSQTYLIFFIHASIGPLTVLSGVSKEKTSDM